MEKERGIRGNEISFDFEKETKENSSLSSWGEEISTWMHKGKYTKEDAKPMFVLLEPRGPHKAHMHLSSITLSH